MILNKSERALKITTYVMNFIFAIVILFPLTFIASYSMKDSTAIYDMPPKLLPNMSKSVSIIIDYSKYANEDKDALLDMMLKDSAIAMYSTNHDMKKSSIGEIKVYGTMNGKNIFYQRAHTMKLQIELDYGVLRGVLLMDRERLFYDNRYKKSAKEIGYDFNTAGIKEKYDLNELGKNALNQEIVNNIIDKERDRVLAGDVKGTTVLSKGSLLLESYKYYLDIPKEMYYNVPFIVKYSYFAFLFNTLLVMAWAVITQVGLCSLTAYSLSRLFSRRMSNILLMYFLATMMVPFMCILLPQAILMKNLGAMNNYGAMLVPYLCPAPFFILLFKGFFDRLPRDLFDAARIDGASLWYTFVRICMPLSKSIISVITLNVIVNAWNDFFWYLFAANRTNLWTINLALYRISLDTTTKQNVIMGLSFMTILPVIILTLIFSKQIKESVVNAGIKG